MSESTSAGGTGKKSKLEIAVRMETSCCEKAVRSALTDVEGISSVAIDVGVETVLVETTLPSQKVMNLIEATGRMAVLRGMGSSQNSNHLGAAVVVLSGSLAKGIIRMVQVDKNTCIMEGTVDGLQPGQHNVAIHRAGDLSSGCDSCGDIFEIEDSTNTQRYGDLGSVMASDNGRAEFRMENNRVKVWDVIGRSMVLHDLQKQNRVGCGIIARSAGLFQNNKNVCACDGVTIWDERNVPIAGHGRQNNTSSAQL